MPLNVKTIDQATYENLRYEIIKQLEESGKKKHDIYTDGEGLVTIGDFCKDVNPHTYIKVVALST